MQIFGDTEGLKNEIEQKYKAQINDVNVSTQKELDQIKWQAGKEIEAIMAQARTDAEIAGREAYQRVLNEEKLKAKQDFEEAREALIKEVIEEVKKRVPKMVKSKEYVEFLKKNTAKEKETSVFGSESAFKKIFPKMKPKKDINGVIVITEDAIYDLTLENAIRTQDELIRRTITKQLFGE